MLFLSSVSYAQYNPLETKKEYNDRHYFDNYEKKQDRQGEPYFGSYGKYDDGSSKAGREPDNWISREETYEERD